MRWIGSTIWNLFMPLALRWSHTEIGIAPTAILFISLLSWVGKEASKRKSVHKAHKVHKSSQSKGVSEIASKRRQATAAKSTQKIKSKIKNESLMFPNGNERVRQGSGSSVESIDCWWRGECCDEGVLISFDSYHQFCVPKKKNRETHFVVASSTQKSH